MLCCAVLYCIVLLCSVLHCIEFYCFLVHCIVVLCGIALYYILAGFRFCHGASNLTTCRLFFQEFTGNSDIKTIVKPFFSQGIKHRYIRFVPTAKNSHPCMRVDVYGQKTGEQ